MNLPRQFLYSVFALSVSLPVGSDAVAKSRAHRVIRVPLSTAITDLLPPGSFVNYRGDVDVDKLVVAPQANGTQDELRVLLSKYDLQVNERGNTYYVAPVGATDPTPIPLPKVTSLNPPTLFNSPGFSFTPVQIEHSALPTAKVAPKRASQVPVHSQPKDLIAAMNSSAAPILQKVTAVPLAPPTPTWSLRQGTLISHDLNIWASVAGWQPVRWNFPKDFVVPAPATITGQFPDAVEQVITALKQQLQASDPGNADIHQDTYPDSKTIVINTNTSESTANGN